MNEANRYVHVAQLLFGQPLLATVEAAETVGAYLRARMEGVDVSANRFVGEQQADPQSGRWKGYRKVGSVGVVSILGELVNRGAWMGASSGLSSYEGIVEQVRQAAADPEVLSILLDINSPGGEAWGMVDAAKGIRAAAGGKKIVALANSAAASAAYGLAVAADEIVINESGLVGSIGVVTVHIDRTEQLKASGVKVSVISTGPKKMVGSSAVPLDEAGETVLRARAARIMDGFAGMIAERRPQLTVDAIYALEGDIFIGSDAVAVGLADRVGTFESVLSDLSRAAGRTTSTKGKSSMMTEANGAPAAETNAGITQAQADAAAAQAVTNAVAADRQRMAALDELAAECNGNADGLKLVADAKANGATAEATALQMVKSGVFKKAAVLGGLQQDDASAQGANPAAPAADAPNKPGTAQTREALEAEWSANAALQRDYITAESYASAILFDRKKQG